VALARIGVERTFLPLLGTSLPDTRSRTNDAPGSGQMAVMMLNSNNDPLIRS
jgi:hypothetical protein